MVATRVVLPGLIIIRDVGIEVLCAMRVDMVGGVRKRLSLIGMHIGHHQQIAEKERDKRKKRQDKTSHYGAATRVSARMVQETILARLFGSLLMSLSPMDLVR